MIRRCSLLLMLCLLLPLSAQAGQEAPAGPEILAVKFHADWCGSCKKMGTVFEDLRQKYDGQPVLFVTLDRTNVSTRAQAELMASALDFGSLYAENSGTGFILLLDGKDRKPLAKLTADQGIKAMGSKLVELLESR